VQAEIEATVEEAVRFGIESEEPTIESMYGHVYG
jgi:TPP-dependent pyruvate/acetoin dehydrogenase alpha subunit